MIIEIHNTLNCNFLHNDNPNYFRNNIFIFSFEWIQMNWDGSNLGQKNEVDK